MSIVSKNHRRNLLLLLFCVFAVIFLVKKLVFPIGSINYDEPVYIYQAETFASGKLYNEIPTPQENFKQWFIVDYNGKRFAKYPFGSGLIYSVGIVLFNNIDIILPILAMLNIFLIFLISKSFFTEKESLFVAFISFFNPFFIINSSLFLSHAPCLSLLLLATVFFIKTLKDQSVLSAVTTGFFLSFAFNTRPDRKSVV